MKDSRNSGFFSSVLNWICSCFWHSSDEENHLLADPEAQQSAERPSEQEQSPPQDKNKQNTVAVCTARSLGYTYTFAAALVTRGISIFLTSLALYKILSANDDHSSSSSLESSSSSELSFFAQLLIEKFILAIPIAFSFGALTGITAFNSKGVFAPFELLAQRHFKDVMIKFAFGIPLSLTMSRLAYNNLKVVTNSTSPYLIPIAIAAGLPSGLGIAEQCGSALQKTYNSLTSLLSCKGGSIHRFMLKFEPFLQNADDKSTSEFINALLQALGLDPTSHPKQEEVRSALTRTLSSDEHSFNRTIQSILSADLASSKYVGKIDLLLLAPIIACSAFATKGLGVTGIVGGMFNQSWEKWLLGIMLAHIPYTVGWSSAVYDIVRGMQQTFHLDCKETCGQRLKGALKILISLSLGAAMACVTFVGSKESLHYSDLIATSLSGIINFAVGAKGTKLAHSEIHEYAAMLMKLLEEEVGKLEPSQKDALLAKVITQVQAFSQDSSRDASKGNDDRETATASATTSTAAKPSQDSVGYKVSTILRQFGYFQPEPRQMQRQTQIQISADDSFQDANSSCC